MKEARLRSKRADDPETAGPHRRDEWSASAPSAGSAGFTAIVHVHAGIQLNVANGFQVDAIPGPDRLGRDPTGDGKRVGFLRMRSNADETDR